MSDPQLAEWILEQTSDALIYADTEGNIRRWNAASTELFGFSPDEALGQTSTSSFPGTCVMRTGEASMLRCKAASSNCR